MTALDIAVPSIDDLEQVRDPAARLLATVEPASRLLQMATSIDHADDIRAQAKALEAYARARDLSREAIGAAQTIVLRAGVRIGQLTEKLPQGGPPDRGAKSGASDFAPQRRSEHRLLAEHADEVESIIAEHAPKGEATMSRALTTIRQRERERDATHRASSTPAPLHEIGSFPVIYCDPPWRYDHAETPRRAIENNYPTMTAEELRALEVPAADDAVLLMWATPPKLTDALDTLRQWGFEYRTCLVWVKDKIGMGYYARQRHELLLVAKRGDLPTPTPSRRPDSVIEAPRGEHSAKPLLHDLIDRMYPGLPKVELFARRPLDRPWWTTWGNEVTA